MQARWHRLNTGVLAAIHDLGAAGEVASVDFWQWKALAQLHELYIEYAEGTRSVHAAKVLLTGGAILTLAVITRSHGKACFCSVVHPQCMSRARDLEQTLQYSSVSMTSSYT